MDLNKMKEYVINIIKEKGVTETFKGLNAANLLNPPKPRTILTKWTVKGHMINIYHLGRDNHVTISYMYKDEGDIGGGMKEFKFEMPVFEEVKNE